MCGRYVLELRYGQVHQVLDDNGLPTADSHRGRGRGRGRDYWGDGTDANGGGADSGPNDVSAAEVDTEVTADDAEADTDADALFRPTYNFAPGYHGIVVRPVHKKTHDDAPSYQLQVMKWGLVPSWLRRRPDDASMMLKTINCRADALASGRGMWAGLRSRKRCVVVASGFYEWLHKGRERVPHYIRRRDGRPLLMAGLWEGGGGSGGSGSGKADDGAGADADVDDGENKQPLYTYTIITTDSNATLRFLHDRMPVLLDYGSTALAAWLDPARAWSAELAGLLKPWAFADTDDGRSLLVDVVSKDVNKAGHSAASMIVPVASADNKANIANFFEAGKGVKGVTGVKGMAGVKRAADNGPGSSPPKKSRVEAGQVQTSPTERQPKTPTLPKRVSATNKPGKAKAGGSQKITSFFGKGAG